MSANSFIDLDSITRWSGREKNFRRALSAHLEKTRGIIVDPAKLYSEGSSQPRLLVVFWIYHPSDNQRVKILTSDGKTFTVELTQEWEEQAL